MKCMNKTLTEARRRVVAANLPLIPPSYRQKYQKAVLGEAGRKDAISAMCQRCMGYENAVSRIRECQILSCPLHPYRPYQVKRGDQKDKASKNNGPVNLVRCSTTEGREAIL